MRAQIEDIDRQLEDKQQEDRRLRDLIAAYQAKVDVVPTRESELVELTRDYATLQATYTKLLAKREDSKLAANLERRQIWRAVQGAGSGVDAGEAFQQHEPHGSRRAASVSAACCSASWLSGLLEFTRFELQDRGGRDLPLRVPRSLPVGSPSCPHCRRAAVVARARRLMWTMTV